MLIKEFSVYLQKLENTASRIEITKILSELLDKSSSEEIDKVVYLSLGILAPSYEGVILNLAEKMMLRAVSLAYNQDLRVVRSLYKKTGDIGDVSERLAKQDARSRKHEMTITEVYEELLKIAKDAGEGSQERKIGRITELLRGLDPLSTRFIARIPVGRLRLGFSEKTVIDSLSGLSGIEAKLIEEAYNIRPDIGYIAELVREGEIKKAKPKVGIPVVPMLAQRLNSTSEMVKKMEEVSVEPKFDGLRIFIHYRRKDNFLKIFTRNMNSIEMNTLPELSEVGKYVTADEVILDTEAVGLDSKREMFLDFQKTVQRRRKHDIEKSANEIPLQFQVFDVLLVDGAGLIHEPYVKRRAVLEKVVVDGKLFRVDENTITKDPEVIKKLHFKYLNMGLEGIIAKRANGTYVSGRTGWNWVKMKEAEGKRGRLSDTLDCVVMGYTLGKGKRVGFGMGQFLAGIKDGNGFKSITKVGTGLSDEQFRELNKRLKLIKLTEKPKDYEVHKDLTPDFWVVPEIVVELAADEITVSPKHTSGYALRFPRLIKFRDDKSPTETTTIKETKELFRIQKI